MTEKRVARLIQRYLDYWLTSLGLRGWRVTWELVEPGADVGYVATSHANGRKRAVHIRFFPEHMRSPAAIEKTVVHEVLHFFDQGLGRDDRLEKYITRLELPLRRLRRRTTGTRT